ncbi:MAG: VCBS repeat-containing protein [Ardenticatenaceae bacterium]|nr:VCBS repeat-containing protein [Ardenticatenaceae bacterium]
MGNSASVFVDLGDVDGDGDLDAFVVNGTSAYQANRVWFNDGTGLFSDSGEPMGNAQSRSIVLGDLNGDGRLMPSSADGVVEQTMKSG